MTGTHWMHVWAAYALVAGGFGVLGLGAVLRHRAAKRRLAVLEPRAAARRRRAGATP
jgi:hypothetical protein